MTCGFPVFQMASKGLQRHCEKEAARVSHWVSKPRGTTLPGRRCLQASSGGPSSLTAVGGPAGGEVTAATILISGEFVSLSDGPFEA